MILACCQFAILQMFYWPDEHEPMRELTKEIKDCDQINGLGCSLDSFIKRAIPYKPVPSFDEVCFCAFYHSYFIKRFAN